MLRVMIFLEAAAFPSPAFLCFCQCDMMNFNYRPLSKIYQNFHQSDLISFDRSQKRYAAKPTLKPRRANTRMRRTPLYQRLRHR